MNFDQICRLCCEQKCSMKKILNDTQQSSLADIFCNVLQIVVYADDHLPQQICDECVTTITNLHQTIERFRQNDLRLRELLVLHCQVKKEEPLELMEPELSLTEVDNVEPVDESSLTESQDEESDKEIVKVVRKVKNKIQPKKHTKKKGNVEKVYDGAAQLPKKRIRKRDPNLPRSNDYKCYVCRSESLGSAEALFEHLNANHVNEVPHTCSICVCETVIIKNVTSLNVHKRMHAMPVKCPHCDKRVLNKSTLQMHFDIKHRKDPHPSRCEQCDKLFPSKEALKVHSQRHNLAYSCEYCGKMFKAPSKMELHIKRKHGKIDKAKCPICQKELNTLEAVLRHIESMHSNEQYSCSSCSKTYTSEVSLRAHEKKHEDPNYETVMNQDWKNYYTIVEDNGTMKKKCNLCDSVLVNISAHMNSKHFKRKFPCDLCEQQFRTKKDLVVHKLEHKEGKFLKCPICDREFNERRNLLSHLKTKQHRDHPLAQSLVWLDAKYPAGGWKRVEAMN